VNTQGIAAPGQPLSDMPANAAFAAAGDESYLGRGHGDVLVRGDDSNSIAPEAKTAKSDRSIDANPPKKFVSFILRDTVFW
jgi:hypothetical protein